MAGSSSRLGPLTPPAPQGRRKNRPWQDDNARRRPRPLCALYAFTKLKAGDGPVLEEQDLGVCLGGWSPAGMHVLAHALWQQRCLEVASRLHHVGVVDKTRRTYPHYGRQRDAPRRIATFRHATLRVAPHRYATLEPLGKPGGSRV